MTYPTELMYSKDHHWVKNSGNQSMIGLTDFILSQLGDVVHLQLPELEVKLHAGETLGTIESTKTVSDLVCPVSGKIIEVNQALFENPQLVMESPYEKGWLLRIELEGNMPQNLLSADEYLSYLSSSSGV